MLITNSVYKMTPPGISISWKISSSLYIGVEASLSPVLMVLGGKTGLIWLIATRLDVGTQSIGGSINPVTPLKSRLDFHTSHSYSVVLMAPSYGLCMAKDLNVRHDAAVQCGCMVPMTVAVHMVPTSDLSWWAGANSIDRVSKFSLNWPPTH
jgi:hypothetical protein